MGAVVGLVEDQAEVVYMLHTVAPGLVGNWGTDQDHLEKALQRRAAQEKSAYCKTPSPDCRYEPKSACHVKKILNTNQLCFWISNATVHSAPLYNRLPKFRMKVDI